jgi:transcriptional regulator with XRE-family HTH domain
MSFNENLKEAMYCKNLTTIQLAALTNINSGTISNYLKTKGSMPPADKALKLAKALDVSVDFLINGYDTKIESSITHKSPFSIEVFKLATKMNNFEKNELSIISNMIDLIVKNKAGTE